MMLIAVNLLFVVLIVFFERKEPKSVWAWVLLLLLLPGVGVVLYLLLGKGLHHRKMFRMREMQSAVEETVREQVKMLEYRELPVTEDYESYRDLMVYNLETLGAVLTDDNDVTIYTCGKDKFADLKKDLEQAKEFIHIQYYIIRWDAVFEELMEVLIRKCREGVRVRILYDSMGCRSFPKKKWKELQALGFETAVFFPPLLGKFQLRVNYRNHRKIVVIDNRIGYVGGFNVGKEYVGDDWRFGNWRDTHLRLEGTGVFSLQLRFLLDYNYATGKNLLGPAAFTGLSPSRQGHCAVQIITSGPDNERHQIRDNYLRLIGKAKKRIYIQTPYFVPDEAILNALLMATQSGVSVILMIPCKPDHPFVYWATYCYAGELVRAGARCYTYDRGFLHSKGLLVDGEVFCFGTANMDIRSFALNFEVNAVVYDREKAAEMEQLLLEDLKDCTLITQQAYAQRGITVRLKEQLFRLFSPIL